MNLFRFCMIASISILFTACAEHTETTRPNIILINVDDMGWKDLGYTGSEYYETPNIDALAASGMIFTNGYATAANCAPSRACMMTGKYTPRHGIYTVGSSERGESRNRKLIPVKNTTTLSRDHKVIAEVLKENGYQTCQAGKWHLSDDPTNYGFDLSIGGGHNGHPTSYYPPYKNVNIARGDASYLTDLIMEKTLEVLDTIQSPYFLYYAPYAVHTPIHQVDSLMHIYNDKPPSNGQDNPKYATMVDNLDRNIGLLTDKLESQRMLKNTLIIFTTDNGGLYGITKQPPLRAGKGSYYEGGIRVPFFFAWRNRIESGTVSEMPIINIDLFPTILDICGISSEDFQMDGISLLPVLQGEHQLSERPLFWHFPVYLQAYNASDNENRDSLFRTRPGTVVRLNNYKLHYYYEDKGIELYDLKNDIGERENVALKYPEKTEALMRIMKQWWSETEAPVPSEKNPDYEPSN